MKHSQYRYTLFVMLSALAATTQCNKDKPPTGPSGAVAPPSATVAPPSAAGPVRGALVRTTIANKGELSEDEQRDFFHLSEGSEILPVFLLERLGVMAQLNQVGFLQDPLDGPQKGFPVGVSIGRPKDLAKFRVNFMGFNCAACHVGEISDGKERRIIIGAPARTDFTQFFRILEDAITRKLDERWAKLEILLWYYDALKAENGTDDASREEERRIKLALVKAALNKTSSPLFKEFKKVFDDANMKQPIKLPVQQLAIESKPAALSLKTINSLSPTPALPLSDGLEAELAGVPHERRKELMMSAKGDWGRILGLLKQRLEFVKKIQKNSDDPNMYTDPGPGRIDAFMTVLTIIYDNVNVPRTSPVSYPHLWGTSELTRFHWDDNTNAIVERNIGQALGLGASFTKVESTVDIRNIHSLGKISAKIAAPKWPFEIVVAKAQSGEKHYTAHCATCHKPNNPESGPRDTDALRVENFANTTINGKPAFQALDHDMKEFKKNAYEAAQVSASDQREMEQRDRLDEVVWSSSTHYSVRSLKGVWATAPYLHNNSVPTLAHLLGLKDRPKTFTMVERDGANYNIEDVGVVFDPNGRKFDWNDNGNGIEGHYYGTKLKDEEKWQLIEYLKTL